KGRVAASLACDADRDRATQNQGSLSVRVERAYALALRLFPADYRANLGAPMLTAFRDSVRARRPMPRLSALRFLAAEFAALASAIAAEWLAKLTTDAATRGRYLPDCRMMRPPGVTRDEWAAGLDAIGDGVDH